MQNSSQLLLEGGTMQNVLVDKETLKVVSIYQWEDGYKLDKSPSPTLLLVYEREDSLDPLKDYQYIDKKFKEVVEPTPPTQTPVTLDTLQEQLLDLSDFIVSGIYTQVGGDDENV